MHKLAEDFFVLAFDLPGIGASRGLPHSAAKSVLADLLLTAAESVGAHSIVVAGLDVGGMIAFAAARDHGPRVVAAIVMNTVIPVLIHGPT
jgi:pimeloyl-ACP methyl ester carboxylesterase